MPYLRYTIDLAIPLDADGKVANNIDKKFSEVLTSAKINEISNENFIEGAESIIKKLKEYAVKINEGSDKEEATVRTVKHICKHDIGLPCEAEHEIGLPLEVEPGIGLPFNVEHDI